MALYSLAELAAMPLPTKAEREQEAREAREATERAEAKGDRALELLRTCMPDPERYGIHASDYEVPPRNGD